MSEKEEKPEKLRLVITIPTKEAIVKKLTELFPALEVKVEEPTKETKHEETTTEKS